MKSRGTACEEIPSPALGASEERYRSLLNSIDVGFCVIELLFDDHDNPVDFRFLETNPAFEKQSGLSDAVGKCMPADLLRRRPDVRAAEMQLAAQSALIGVSRAALFPSIALPGSVGLASTSADWSTQTLSWAIGPTLLWNVFDYGRLKNQVLVQDARFQQLYEVYQDTVLRAARELDDAAVAFAKGRVQIDLLNQAVTAARRSLDIATVQYREGLVDFERVLDSQRTLFTQQDRLVSNRGNVSQSLIALYKAMGDSYICVFLAQGWTRAQAVTLDLHR